MKPISIVTNIKFEIVCLLADNLANHFSQKKQNSTKRIRKKL